MQLLPASSAPTPARTAIAPRSAVGSVGRVTELLSHTSARTDQERVLQGEFLEKGRETGPARSRRPEVYESRREDHPAFYRRYQNHDLAQRQALAAYARHASADSGAVAGGGVDYFI